MSLINEALKKAQKERGGEVPPLAAMPTVGGEPAANIARRGKSSGFPLSLGLGLGAVALAVVIGGVLVLRKPSDVKPVVVAEAPAAKPAPVDSQPAAIPPAPAATIVPPVVTTPPASTPVPATTPRIELPVPVVVAETPRPAAPPASAPIVPAPATATAITTPVVAASPSLPPQAESARPGKLEPRAINFIESLRVAGIRASATDSKVLMNDRVYRLGTVVEHEMGLKLTGITSNSLTFEDERGGTYTRTF